MNVHFWKCANYYDPNEPRVPEPFFITTFSIIFSIFLLFPIVSLILYPIKYFRKFLLLICCKDLRCVQSFVDAFQGHYKDGTNGTRDLRAMASLQFVARLTLHITFRAWYSYSQLIFARMVYTNILLILMSVCLFSIRPIRKDCINTVEALLYSLVAMTSLLFGAINFYHTNQVYIMYLIMFFIALPSSIFYALFVYKIMLKIPLCESLVGHLKKHLLRNRESPTAVTQHYPHRLTFPNEYTPLIS